MGDIKVKKYLWAEFVLLSIIFLFFMLKMDIYSVLFAGMNLLLLLESVSYVAFTFLYVVIKRHTKTSLLALNAFAFVSVAVFIASFANRYTNRLQLIELISLFENILFYFIILMPLIFMAFFYVYLRRKFKPRMIFDVAVVVLVFVITTAYFLGLIYSKLGINDEVLINYLSVNAFVRGLDPYSMNFTSELLASKVGFSMTTSNEILGRFQYPALYLFAVLPFYLFSNGKSITLNSMQLALGLEAGTYLTLLIFVVAIVIDRKKVAKPQYWLIIFLGVGVSHIASINTYLMLVLIFAAYAKIDKPYAFAILGLALALQEELWIPVVLLIVYSFRSYGMRFGMRNLLGSIIVFLILNSYFILYDPSSFFISVFDPMTGTLLPGASSVFAFMIALHFPILISSYQALFLLAIALAAIAVFHFNERKLVGLLSFVPFMFLQHSLISYYATFISLLFFGFYVKEEKSKKKSFYGRGWSYLMLLLALLVAAAMISVVIMSHAAYEKTFNMKIVNQQIQQNSSANYTLYKGTLIYSTNAPSKVYLFLLGLENNSEYLFGLGNQSLISSPIKCRSGECINKNMIMLNGSGSYNFSIPVSWKGNGPIFSYTAVIYDKNHAYFSRPVTDYVDLMDHYRIASSAN